MCLASGILQKGGKLPCPVDASGIFTSDVPDFKGLHVKVTLLANKPVNSSLAALVGALNQGGKRPGGETGSPLLVQCVMRRRTGTSAPSAFPVR